MSQVLIHAFIGGLLIGAGAALLLLRTGQVAGISGIFNRLLQADWGSNYWRPLFIAGLLAPALVRSVGPVQFAGDTVWMLGAGLLVGFGTHLGSGCTSGHGVCGLAQGSKRSLVATLSFMLTGVVTAWIVRHSGLL